MKRLIVSLYMVMFLLVSVLGSYIISFNFNINNDNNLIANYNNILNKNKYLQSRVHMFYDYIVSKERILGLGEGTFSSVLNKEYIINLYRKRLLDLTHSILKGDRIIKLYTNEEMERVKGELINRIGGFKLLSTEQQGDILIEIDKMLNFIEYNLLYYSPLLNIINTESIKALYDGVYSGVISLLVILLILGIALLKWNEISLSNIISLNLMSIITIFSMNIYITYLVNHNISNTMINDILELANNLILISIKQAVYINVIYNVLVASIYLIGTKYFKTRV